MIRFYKGRPLRAGRLGILPAAFNPPTRAHLALAAAAREEHELAQVVFLLPEVFPHKRYVGTSFKDRIALLQAALSGEDAYAIASSGGGLFIEIARAFREECGPEVEIYLLCGRDAAERIVNWDYGDGPAFIDQLREFQLLVASRQGAYRAPEPYQKRIHPIELPGTFDEVSASAVRQAIIEGRAWRSWVPQGAAREIDRRGLYARQES